MDQIPHAPLSQSIIKFIDILLDFYSSLPSAFTHQMRNLQACLFYGQDLNKLTFDLRDKLGVKEKCKMNETQNSWGEVCWKTKALGGQNESNKQNSFDMNNCNKVHACKTVKKHHNSQSILSQHQNTSFTQSSQKSFHLQCNNTKTKFNQFARSSHKTFIKVTKKRQPSQEEFEAIHQSFSKEAPHISKILGLKVEQILSIMDSLQLVDHQEGKAV